ncbi:hypothetical protein [Paraburkholderia saeva]|uniref:Uncharacterized protein n=1 Tax=Paraburkholderia saeva TaxID=2777537 RepID=A0A9N8RSY0_9BURK|nr:hypothetical protein [Paraburkholderia saeva]CAG4886734.1 hypothetical protein R70241_00248 [Paraburkholderia saeva]CAG4887219.1 hypothetical protein LMG31841_00370 [Paraburkholderia saeva]
MSIHASSSVCDDPIVSLESWSIRESSTGARHFVGFNLAERDGRVSTAIISFDATTRTGVTATGRRYVLVGRAGFDRDAEYVWQWAVRQWRIQKWSDVTAQLVPDWRRPLPVGQCDEVGPTAAGNGASAVSDMADFDRRDVWGTDFMEDADDHAA